MPHAQRADPVHRLHADHADRRLGIGGKLLAAFGAIAALTIAATVIAWILFDNVRGNLAIIAEDSLPEIAASFRIAEQSARISAAIPRMISARSASDLSALKSTLNARLETITTLAGGHGGHETDFAPLVEELQTSVQGLRSGVEMLERAVQGSLISRQKRVTLLDALSSAHLQFKETIDPMIEAARNEMVDSTRRQVADGASRIAALIDESFESLRAVMHIQADINLITAVLHQVAASDDSRLIRDKRFAIVEPIAEIKNHASQVSEVEEGDLYVDLANEILDIAIGARSVFKLRNAVLSANELQESTADSRLSAAISDLDKAHGKFLQLGRQIINAIDARTLQAAAEASKESQFIVSGTEEGIQRLEILLSIHTDTNEMFGMLSEAGTAIYSEDIEALRLRGNLLEKRIHEALLTYESGQPDPALRSSVEAVVSYGQGERSILSARLSQLAFEHDAASILAESQRLAARLGESAQGLVEDAERAGASAEVRTREALSTGGVVLMGIAALSLAAALLIAWLYVYRGIVHRLTSLSASMLSIAEGDLDTEILFKGGNDEITDMRKALVVFRDDAFKRRQAEEALRESERRMRLILATSPIGVGISRAEDGTLVYANERLAEQFGQSARDMIGSPVTDLYESADERERLLARVGKDGSVRDAEVLLKKADGSKFWSLLSFFPIEYAGEHARLGWIYDIAERKRAEQELREAKESAEQALSNLKAAQERLVQTEKMASLGQLTAGVAHEIKNPLNFVKNFAEVSSELVNELKEDLQAAIETLEEAQRNETLDQFATIEDMLSKIKEHGDRANSIVQSMLAHTREGPTSTQPTDLNALLNESLDLAFHAARAEDNSFNVTLERDLDADVGELALYPADLMRVFLNLIGNAFYATKKRAVESGGGDDYVPTVRVSTRCKDSAVDVRVRDNGTGIPQPVKGKIFEPFFTTKPPGEGTGLGLSLSYETVVHQHGGWMEVSSREGEFTEFLVTLPR